MRIHRASGIPGVAACYRSGRFGRSVRTTKSTIAFLHLGQTHDDFPDVGAALLRLGVRSELVALNDADRVDWSRYAAVSVRECRGYHLEDRFVARVESVQRRFASARIVNSMNVICGAFDKRTYLPVLESAGVETVPTYWLDADSLWTVNTLFDLTGWDDIVIKPTVSSKSWNTFRLVRSASGVQIHAAGLPASPIECNSAQCEAILRESLGGRSLCTQAFMPEVQSIGETSFVFLGGMLSHAIRKTPAPGGWLAHEFYGGHNAIHSPCVSEAHWSEQIYRLMEAQLGDMEYARIDALTERGKLLLLECELIVPRLFLQESGTVSRYAEVLASRIHF